MVGFNPTNQSKFKKLFKKLTSDWLKKSRSSKHGRRSGEQRGFAPPWIFINDTDKIQGGLMVLFFGLVFSVSPP